MRRNLPKYEIVGINDGPKEDLNGIMEEGYRSHREEVKEWSKEVPKEKIDEKMETQQSKKNN